MSAPTEAEIREALRQRCILYPSDNPRAKLREVIDDYAAFMSGTAYKVLESLDPRELDDDEADDIWSSDLRTSEALRMRSLAAEAIERAWAAAERVIVDEMVKAGLAFAVEYPDAPRARVPA